MDLMETWSTQTGRGCMKLDSFLIAQHHHLRRLQGQPVRVLEIGVLAGGSLEIWQRYFGPQAVVFGADIVPNATQNAPDFLVHIGDQADPEFLREVVAESGPFDVVIDDGGHEMHQQITSFEVLYPLLNDNGVYIVEDTCTSYWDEFDGGVEVPGTFVEYAKKKVDELNADFTPDIEPSSFTRSTTSVSFHQGMVVFEKIANGPTQYIVCSGDDAPLQYFGMRYGTGFA